MRRFAQGNPNRERLSDESASKGTVLFFLVLLLTIPSTVEAQAVWESLAGLPTPRRLLAAAAVEDKIYTFGGCGSPCFHPTLHPSAFEETLVEVFDTENNVWEPPGTRGRIPVIFFGGAAATLGRFVYLAGGVFSGNVLLRYDPASDTWESMSPMPTSRYGLALVALDDKLYAVGGNGPTGALEIYDPATDTWTGGLSIPSMPTPRVYLAAAALDGKLYAVGGSPDCCGASQSAVLEVYDPQMSSWETRRSLPVAQQSSAAVATDCKLYVFGGFVPGDGTRGNVFEYDPDSNNWSDDLPEIMARDQAPAALVDGSAYVLGGSVNCHCTALGANERLRLPLCPGKPQADVAITKTNHRNSVTPGEEITYEIVVTNKGPDFAEGALVTDDFQAKLRGVTWTCDKCRPSSGSDPMECRVNLEVKEWMTCSATGTLAANATGQLCNVAKVRSTGLFKDPDKSNNKARDCDPIIPIPPPHADLAVMKTNKVDVVSACGKMPPYTIVVTNKGSDPVEGARIDDDFPLDKLEEVSWTCEAGPGARCEEPQGTKSIHHDKVVLPVNGWVTYTVEGRVRDDAEGVLENTCTVSPPAGVVDRDLSDNSATDRDEIIRPFGLTITKSNDVEVIPACLDEEIPLYDIIVRNEGRCPVPEASVTDVFMHLDAVSWTCEASPGSSCSPGGEGDINDGVSLLKRGELTYSVSGIVSVEAPETLSNTACVEAPPDVKVCATHEDKVLKEADLAISKTNGVDEVLACLPTSYEITVTNNGPCPVATARVTDDFPEALLGAIDLEEEVSLPAGGSVTYTVSGEVAENATGNLENTACVAIESLPDVIDRDPSNNCSTVRDPIGKQDTDLAATKMTTSQVMAGGLVTYDILITNAGPAKADATVTDEFAEELSGVEWTCAPVGDATCAPAAAGDVHDAVTVAPGATLTYMTGGLLSPMATGELCNTVTVEPGICFEDPNLENNTFTVCDSISGFPDCNHNGVPDDEDINSGFSDDVNGDETPDECQVGGADLYCSGTASGGTMAVSFDAVAGVFPACTVMIVTMAGDPIATVLADMAAAINADACLAPRGVSAKAVDNTLWLMGLLLDPSQVSVTITDPTISCSVTVTGIPALSIWGFGALILLLAAVAVRRLGRHSARA